MFKIGDNIERFIIDQPEVPAMPGVVQAIKVNENGTQVYAGGPTWGSWFDIANATAIVQIRPVGGAKRMNPEQALGILYTHAYQSLPKPGEEPELFAEMEGEIEQANKVLATVIDLWRNE